MDDSRKEQPTDIKFSDKRERPGNEPSPMDSAQDSPAPDSQESVGNGEEQVEINYLEDLRRVQAEFDNYRKRMLREQTQFAQRASARLIGSLLPILDNFESAISHGEGGSGVELVYRELKKLLEDEGLEEIEAEGTPFDPMMHEAFEAVADDSVDEPTVRSVLRRGYAFKGQVMRPSMVSVARPPESTDEAAEKDVAEG